VLNKRKLKESVMRCEESDDPIVVMKSQPMKPGNGVEGKTETTRWLLAWGL
jgi:hypothetical protein